MAKSFPFNKYNNDENYIKIKNNYSNIYINKENVNIDDIIKSLCKYCRKKHW